MDFGDLEVTRAAHDQARAALGIGKRVAGLEHGAGVGHRLVQELLEPIHAFCRALDGARPTRRKEVLYELGPMRRRTLQDRIGDRVQIIATGGVDSADKALRLLDAGATAVSYFTGFITRGPILARRILEALRDRI